MHTHVKGAMNFFSDLQKFYLWNEQDTSIHTSAESPFSHQLAVFSFGPNLEWAMHKYATELCIVQFERI